MGEHELRQGLARLKYNTLDVERVVQECLKDPRAECAKVKKLSHQALAKGRSQMKSGENKKANASFAFAYQMRCTSDWIWTNALGNKGDEGHAKYLQLSRQFGMLAAGKRPLTQEGQQYIEKLIEQIRD